MRNEDVTSAEEQAVIAYREMRRSLVMFASVETDIITRRNADKLPPAVESLLIADRAVWRERVLLFAAVYHVERAEAARRMVGSPLSAVTYRYPDREK
jgi:hypothetical protein